MKKFVVYTDGAARGNPGPAGAGWLAFDSDGKGVHRGKKYLGELTNNQAEYQALLLALDAVIKLGGDEVVIYSDSELMVRQINGEYKVKNEGLKPLFQKVRLILSRLHCYHICYIPREKNQKADQLANEAIDEGSLKM